MSAPEPYRPLAGVRILAWEQAVALPMATRLLADLGATVVRLESHARGAARVRHTANDLVRNKQSLALDLTHDEARELVRRLAARVDIVCENFTPRVKQGFGLGYATLSAENPRLIMLSLTGYGQSGRWANRPTYGPGIEAAAGHAHSAGYPDAPPTRPGTIVYADNISGFYAALALLGALLRRRETGRGEYIDLAMYEANAFHLGPSLLRSSLTGQPIERRGNGDATALLQDVFASREPERWLAVSVWPSQAGALATLLGVEPDAGALAAALKEWIAARPSDEAAEQLQAAGIAASPVLNARDLLQNPQLRAHGAFAPVRHDAPVNGYAAHPHAASPWRCDGRERAPLTEAPAIGGDSRAVLRDWLGPPDAEIDALIAGGALGVADGRPAPQPHRPSAEEVQRKLAWHVIAGYDADPGAVAGAQTVPAPSLEG